MNTSPTDLKLIRQELQNSCLQQQTALRPGSRLHLFRNDSLSIPCGSVR